MSKSTSRKHTDRPSLTDGQFAKLEDWEKEYVGVPVSDKRREHLFRRNPTQEDVEEFLLDMVPLWFRDKVPRPVVPAQEFLKIMQHP